MSEFLALTCLQCGGKLQIRDDKTEFTCPYCGTPHIYNSDQGMFFMSKIEKSLKNVEKGVDKTAAELGLKRLHEVLIRMPFEGNLKSIKDSIWGDMSALSFALRDCLKALLRKETPNRQISKLKKAFIGEFSEVEMKNKWFSTLNDGEFKTMIAFCDEQIA